MRLKDIQKYEKDGEAGVTKDNKQTTVSSRKVRQLIKIVDEIEVEKSDIEWE